MIVHLRKYWSPSQAVVQGQAALQLPSILCIQRDVFHPCEDVGVGTLREVARFSEKKVSQSYARRRAAKTKTGRTLSSGGKDDPRVGDPAAERELMSSTRHADVASK